VTGGPLTLRPARWEDRWLIWRWRNDTAARRASFDGAAIPAPVHARWFELTLARADRRLYVAFVDGRPVASARLDLAPPGAADHGHARAAVGTVSLAVAPAWRGRGLGPRVLEALAEEAFHRLSVSRLLAHVKADNVPSRRAFERAGFTVVAGGSALVLARDRRAAAPHRRGRAR